MLRTLPVSSGSSTSASSSVAASVASSVAASVASSVAAFSIYFSPPLKNDRNKVLVNSTLHLLNYHLCDINAIIGLQLSLPAKGFQVR